MFKYYLEADLKLTKSPKPTDKFLTADDIDFVDVESGPDELIFKLFLKGTKKSIANAQINISGKWVDSEVEEIYGDKGSRLKQLGKTTEELKKALAGRYHAFKSSQVKFIASEQTGAGKLLYDFILMYLKINKINQGWIIPDRNSVSTSAENRWKKYEQSELIETKEIDNILDPKTPPKIDDDLIHQNSALDKAYRLKSDVSETISKEQFERIKKRPQ